MRMDDYEAELKQHRQEDAGRWPEYQGTVDFSFLNIKATCTAMMLVGAKAYYRDVDVAELMPHGDAVKGWALALAGAFILRDGYPMLCRQRCRILRADIARGGVITNPARPTLIGEYLQPSVAVQICPEPGCRTPTAFPTTNEPRCAAHIHTNNARLRAEKSINRPDGPDVTPSSVCGNDEQEENVTASYHDTNGNMLWEENPYGFKAMFGVGQTVHQIFHKEAPGKRYTVVFSRFVGVFGRGHAYYVVEPYRETLAAHHLFLSKRHTPYD